ncbi:MAG: sel1 repeat family protein [Deltaproteobacteria bacterium]|jgi:TPR repeat protein|nr:sel1 repeat family protein [Deltaproteobacteria bacterium]
MLNRPVLILALLLAFTLGTLSLNATAQTKPNTPPATPAADPKAAAPAPENQQSVEEILQNLNKEAAAGNPRAMIALGSIHENADLSSRDYGAALNWFKKAADKNLAEGHYKVGSFYEVGLGVKSNLKSAFQSFEKAANLGLSEAEFKLSQLYAFGLGVNQDQKKSLEYLNKAADKNYPPALNELGVVNILAQMGQKKDEKKAFELFTKGAEGGFSESMLNLGVIYRDGLGRPVNNVQALKWFLLARAFGSPTPGVAETIINTRDKLKPAEVKTAEKEATAWRDEQVKKAKAVADAAQAAQAQNAANQDQKKR